MLACLTLGEGWWAATPGICQQPGTLHGVAQEVVCGLAPAIWPRRNLFNLDPTLPASQDQVSGHPGLPRMFLLAAPGALHPGHPSLPGNGGGVALLAGLSKTLGTENNGVSG